MTKRLNHTQTVFQSASPSLFSKKYLSKKQAKHVLMDQTMFLKLSYDEFLFLLKLIMQSSDDTWASERPISEFEIDSLEFSKAQIEGLLNILEKKQLISVDISIQNFYRICLRGLYNTLLPLLPQEYIDMEEFL